MVPSLWALPRALSTVNRCTVVFSGKWLVCARLALGWGGDHRAGASAHYVHRNETPFSLNPGPGFGAAPGKEPWAQRQVRQASMPQRRDWQAFPTKGRRLNMLGFAGPTVSGTTTQLL